MLYRVNYEHLIVELLLANDMLIAQFFEVCCQMLYSVRLLLLLFELGAHLGEVEHFLWRLTHLTAHFTVFLFARRALAHLELGQAAVVRAVSYGYSLAFHVLATEHLE